MKPAADGNSVALSVTLRMRQRRLLLHLADPCMAPHAAHLLHGAHREALGVSLHSQPLLLAGWLATAAAAPPEPKPQGLRPPPAPPPDGTDLPPAVHVRGGRPGGAHRRMKVPEGRPLRAGRSKVPEGRAQKQPEGRGPRSKEGRPTSRDARPTTRISFGSAMRTTSMKWSCSNRHM